MKYSDWQLQGQALIASPEEAFERMRAIRHIMPMRSILTSGGYDPVHPGHITCAMEARARCTQELLDETFAHATLIVVVNGDGFLKKKKGRAFMPLKVRCQIMSAFYGVNIVVPFVPSDPNDMTVCEALKLIQPDVFAKGGDRTGIENIPEWDTCLEYGIQVVTNCGDDKHWSSSNFLGDYAAWAREVENA